MLVMLVLPVMLVMLVLLVMWVMLVMLVMPVMLVMRVMLVMLVMLVMRVMLVMLAMRSRPRPTFSTDCTTHNVRLQHHPKQVTRQTPHLALVGRTRRRLQ